MKKANVVFKLSLILALFAGYIITAPTPAKADSEDSFTVCAAVLPCKNDGSGEVIEKFAKGACGAIYKTQCDNYAFNQAQQSVASCTNENTGLKDELRKLKRQLKKSSKKK